MISVAIGHALEDFDFVIDPFQETGAERPAAVRQDAIEFACHAMREMPERGQAA